MFISDNTTNVCSVNPKAHFCQMLQQVYTGRPGACMGLVRKVKDSLPRLYLNANHKRKKSSAVKKYKLISLTFSFFVSAESPWNSLLSSKWSGKSLKHTKELWKQMCSEALQLQIKQRDAFTYIYTNEKICCRLTVTIKKKNLFF